MEMLFHDDRTAPGFHLPTHRDRQYLYSQSTITRASRL